MAFLKISPSPKTPPKWRKQLSFVKKSYDSEEASILQSIFMKVGSGFVGAPKPRSSLKTLLNLLLSSFELVF